MDGNIAMGNQLEQPDMYAPLGKQIKDYLHLYTGQLAELSNLTQAMTAYGWEEGQVRITGYLIDCLAKGGKFTIKPILRKLSSMTEEEKEKLFDSVFPEGWMTRSINWAGKIDFINYYLNLEAVNNSGLFDQIIRSMDFKHHIKMVNWVRENKFDADELIDSGLALDKENK